MPGAFKLDHLQPFKPILFWKIFNFFTFILGSPFLLPQRANNGKREILATSNMDEAEGFQCLGHSNWITCSLLSHFCSVNFSTFSLSYWEPILITSVGPKPNFNLVITLIPNLISGYQVQVDISIIRYLPNIRLLA